MNLGRLSITRPHRARHWYDGVWIMWRLKSGDDEPPWLQHYRFIRIETQW